MLRTIGRIICRHCINIHVLVTWSLYIFVTDQFIDKNSNVEIKSDVAVNLSGKRLPSAGRPCKRKNWFDLNVIIRGYVYARSVVHATEIHLRSLIGALT